MPMPTFILQTRQFLWELRDLISLVVVELDDEKVLEMEEHAWQPGAGWGVRAAWKHTGNPDVTMLATFYSPESGQALIGRVATLLTDMAISGTTVNLPLVSACDLQLEGRDPRLERLQARLAASAASAAVARVKGPREPRAIELGSPGLQGGEPAAAGEIGWDEPWGLPLCTHYEFEYRVDVLGDGWAALREYRGQTTMITPGPHNARPL